MLLQKPSSKIKSRSVEGAEVVSLDLYAMLRALSSWFILFAVLASLLSSCLSKDHFVSPRMPDVDDQVSSSITFPDLYEASIAELQDGLQKGHFSSVDLIKVGTHAGSTSFYSTLNFIVGFRRILRGSRK